MEEPREPRGADGKEVVRASAQYLGHGMTLAASVALFGWIGSAVGRRVGAEALLTLLGILFGGAAGFYGMYVQLVVRPRSESDEDSAKGGRK
jgi:hypothetical protein